MNKSKLAIREYKGDLFDAPPNTLLIHACNCQGSWGAGIAKEFQERYPHAYSDYQYTCSNNNNILGTAHLVLPIKLVENTLTTNIPNTHFIGCLFTSYYYGRLKGSESEILEATKSSMIDLLNKVTEWNKLDYGYTKIKEIRMCRINAGLFGIEWYKTKKVIEDINLQNSNIKTIKVIVLSNIF